MSADDYNHPLHLAQNETALAIGTIVTITAVIHNVALLIIHSHHIAKSKPKSHVQRLSLLSMAVTLAFLIVLFFTVYPWTFPIPHPILNPIATLGCRWHFKLSGIFMISYKFSLYLLFMERLFAIFRNGADLQFNSNHILCARFVLGTCWLTEETLVLLCIDARHSESNPLICVDETKLFMLFIYITMDLTFCISISVMFTRRLLALHVQTTTQVIAGNTHIETGSSTQSGTHVSESSKESATSSISLSIASKSTLLSCVALITSELAIFGTAATGLFGLFLSLDCMVNSWCIMLIFKPYDQIFQSICCLGQRLIGMRFLACYSCHCCCRIH